MFGELREMLGRPLLKSLHALAKRPEPSQKLTGRRLRGLNAGLYLAHALLEAMLGPAER